MHNQRIERLWRDVYQKVVYTFYLSLNAMEENRVLNINDPVHVFCAQSVFLPHLNRALEEWRLTKNKQPVRTENNSTPEQLWTARLVGLRHSQSTAVRNLTDGPVVSDLIQQVLPSSSKHPTGCVGDCC